MTSTYNVSATYRVPIVKAVSLHLLILSLFASSWEPNHESEPKPQVIVQARMLSMNDPVLARKQREQEKLKAQQRAAEERRQEEARLKAQEQRKAEEKRKAEERRKAEQRKQEEARKAEARKEEERRKAEEKRKQEEAKRLAEAERQRELQRQRELEDEFASALAEETELMQQETDLTAVQSYLGLIQQRIRDNWHRPLSARRGMKTLLQVKLVPTGEVQNVIVIESSGDSAFDRSAIQAVQRAEKFSELQSLEPRVFDQHFRTLKMLFNPLDLDR